MHMLQITHEANIIGPNDPNNFQQQHCLTCYIFMMQSSVEESNTIKTSNQQNKNRDDMKETIYWKNTLSECLCMVPWQMIQMEYWWHISGSGCLASEVTLHLLRLFLVHFDRMMICYSQDSWTSGFLCLRVAHFCSRRPAYYSQDSYSFVHNCSWWAEWARGRLWGLQDWGNSLQPGWIFFLPNYFRYLAPHVFLPS